jgi:hypothetical protein
MDQPDRGGALRAARRGLDGPTIAEEFIVSEQMANYRLHATGVLLQIQRRSTKP